MKRLRPDTTIADLERKFSSELSEAKQCLLHIGNRHLSSLCAGIPCVHYKPQAGQTVLLVLYSYSSIKRSFAIPVAYCEADGSVIDIKTAKPNRIWTLFLIMSETGEFRTEFIRNRGDAFLNLRPDFSPLEEYRDEFICHVQSIDGEQMFFDVERFFQERRKLSEEKRYNMKPVKKVSPAADDRERLKKDAQKSGRQNRINKKSQINKDMIEQGNNTTAENDINLTQVKRKMIEVALSRNGGNRRDAAHELGISERTLYRRIKDFHIDERKLVDRKSQIELNRVLVNSLDGRCFLNLSQEERMEGFCFSKTSTGLDTLYIGCDNHWGYSHLYHDNYGTFRPDNVFCGKEVQLVISESPDLREITREKFSEMERVVNERILLYRQRDEEFEQIRERFYISEEEDV